MGLTRQDLKDSTDAKVNTNAVRSNTGGNVNTLFTEVIDSIGGRGYDSTRTYTALDDIVIYNEELWLCTTTIAVPEAFNSSKWKLLTPLSFLTIVTAPSTIVIFPFDVGSTNYSLSLFVYDATGNQIGGIQVTNRQADRYTIVLPVDGFVDTTIKLNN